MTPETSELQGRAYSLSTNWLAYACLFGNGCFAVAVLALHLLQPGLSPLNEAVSCYVHGTHGWLLTVGLLAWGLGSGALLVGLARTVRIRVGKAGIWGLAVWSVGVLIGGLFPADPPGHWDKPPSVAGLIHGNAALVAFIALPIAAFMLARGLRRVPEWRRIAGVLYTLAIATFVSLIAFFMSLVPVLVSPGPPILLGLTERILLAVYVAWIGVAAIGLRTSADQTRTD
jgi:Protein of unknown function (DUF998)